VPDDEADAPQLATEDFPEHETDEDAQEQGVRETEARPAAVELHRIVRLQLHAEDRDSVDEPLGHEIGGVGPQQQRHESDFQLHVTLKRVGLEVVRGPAQRSRLIASGTSQTATSR
jgi:hypothetical protein